MFHKDNDGMERAVLKAPAENEITESKLDQV